MLRIGTISATSAGAAGVAPGPAAPREPRPGGWRARSGWAKASVGMVIGRGPRVIRQGRGRAVKNRAEGCGGGAGGRGGAGAGQVGEDGLYDAGVLDGGDDAQPGASERAEPRRHLLRERLQE